MDSPTKKRGAKAAARTEPAAKARRPVRAELVWDGKYDEAGRKVAPLRLALPFQTVETVNESAQDRQRGFEFGFREEAWRNRLIWGDKKYVLPSLLQEFAGKVNLIYIDPPFDTGADFSFTAQVPDDPDPTEDDSFEFNKEPSILEQKAYRDIWGGAETHLDAYLKWLYDTVVTLHELLHEEGSIFLHIDWHGGHYAKLVLDEVFGQKNFVNEIIWWYYNKFQGNINHFAKNHDTVFWYRKSSKFRFVKQKEERDKPVKQIKRVWDKEKGRIVNLKGEEGQILYQEATHRSVDDVWRISMLQPADRTENLFYPTQKPEALLRRIVETASTGNDLVLDCFCGSGTTPAVAEKLGRRWIACDLGRFAIHTTRKRLLSNSDVSPFIVQNLGKYERQQWAGAEFGEGQAAARQKAYVEFILKLANASPLHGHAWLHGVRGGHYVHVGAVDAPVTAGDITAIAAEFKKAIGTGKDAPTTNTVEVLGWDFAFEVNEQAKQQAAAVNVQMRFLRIPRDVMDKRARDEGDIKFFELGALSVDVETKKRNVTLKLTDFVIPPDDVPEEARRAIKHWSQWLDYWAVDWDNKNDTFHNEWQTYRTRKDKTLALETTHSYDEPGDYTIVVKAIDILGNDTTKTVRARIG